MKNIKRKDLTGLKFGFLTVKEMLYNYNGRRTYCRCECECGKEKIISADHLQKRKNQSCGCKTSYFRSIHNRTDETNNKYGRLTIIEIDYNENFSIAKCLCDCGKIVKVLKADVVSGHTQSCGCLQKEMASKNSTKDFTNLCSTSGVRLIDKAYKYKSDVWYWNCLCPICGKIFQALPAKILSNHTTSCGCKVQSSKERIIENFLIKNNIKYEKEKRFDDCKYKYTLPFDFAIYNSSGNLIFLIEYDGEQHFRPVDIYGGEVAFKNTKIRDNIKNEYCKQHDIKLIRFNYKDNNEYIFKTITNTIYP